MAPAGESYFSGEFFATVHQCPHYQDYFTRFWDSSDGIGVSPERIYPMLMFIPFFIFWVILRKVCKAFFPRVAVALGVKKRSVQEKFSYQLWLGLFYLVSTGVGAWGYKDEEWFQFPVGKSACASMFDNWPVRPSAFMEFAYRYQLGFYFAELYAIFNEPRRSDFWEYVLHHVTTILLVSMSNLDLQMRTGSYIFFIHDIPDIFLCLAKCMHYLKKEVPTNTLFGLFVVTFFFFRLICLPSCVLCIFCIAGSFKSMPFTHMYKITNILLGVVLQGLHVFWFALILRMVYRLATGVKGDVRSDDDDDDENDNNKKKSVPASSEGRKSINKKNKQN